MHLRTWSEPVTNTKPYHCLGKHSLHVYPQGKYKREWWHTVTEIYTIACVHPMPSSKLQNCPERIMTQVLVFRVTLLQGYRNDRSLKQIPIRHAEMVGWTQIYYCGVEIESFEWGNIEKESTITVQWDLIRIDQNEGRIRDRPGCWICLWGQFLSPKKNKSHVCHLLGHSTVNNIVLSVYEPALRMVKQEPSQFSNIVSFSDSACPVLTVVFGFERWKWGARSNKWG